MNINSPFVLGDLDGSTSRQILLGIQAGIIDIEEREIECLAKIINKETETLIFINSDVELGENEKSQLSEHELRKLTNNRQKDAVLNFQANTDLQQEMEKLYPHLTFQPCQTLCISIGDGMHDRFSNNKDIDPAIREKMKENGAIFITGNHDVFHTKRPLHNYKNQIFKYIKVGNIFK